MRLALKDGVESRGMRPELGLALQVSAAVYEDHGIPLMVTSLLDGVHPAGGDNDPHYLGLAADLRLPSRYTTIPSTDERVASDLTVALGSEWKVVLEADHIHIQFKAWKNEVPTQGAIT